MRMLELVLVGSIVLLAGCNAASFVQHHNLHLQSLSQHQTGALTSPLQPPSVPIAETLLTYCQALTADDISTAFALLDPATQHVVTEADFDAQLDRSVLVHRGLRTCQVLDFIAVFQGKDANAAITLRYGDRSQDKVALALLKEDHQWKILFVGFLCTLPSGSRNFQAAPCCPLVSLHVLFPHPCLHQGSDVAAV